MNGEKKGFAVNSLGSVNNKISSFQILQNLSSASHPANFFQIRAYDHTNFNYIGSGLAKSGYSCGFYTNGSTAQNGCDDLRKWAQWQVLWFITMTTWDDDIESISGYYRN